jgi:hypothetical protein
MKLKMVQKISNASELMPLGMMMLWEGDKEVPEGFKCIKEFTEDEIEEMRKHSDHSRTRSLLKRKNLN